MKFDKEMTLRGEKSRVVFKTWYFLVSTDSCTLQKKLLFLEHFSDSRFLSSYFHLDWRLVEGKACWIAEVSPYALQI